MKCTERQLRENSMCLFLPPAPVPRGPPFPAALWESSPVPTAVPSGPCDSLAAAWLIALTHASPPLPGVCHHHTLYRPLALHQHLCLDGDVLPISLQGRDHFSSALVSTAWHIMKNSR